MYRKIIVWILTLAMILSLPAAGFAAEEDTLLPSEVTEAAADNNAAEETAAEDEDGSEPAAEEEPAEVPSEATEDPSEEIPAEETDVNTDEESLPAAEENEKDEIKEQPAASEEPEADPADPADETVTGEKPQAEDQDKDAGDAEKTAEKPEKSLKEEKTKDSSKKDEAKKSEAKKDEKKPAADPVKKTETAEKPEAALAPAANPAELIKQVLETVVRKAMAGSVDNSTPLADGEYTQFEYEFTGGTGKAKLTLEKIVVSGGKATGVFAASSNSMTHVYYLGHTGSTEEDPAYYDPSTKTCGTGVLKIENRSVSFPVQLNKETEVACRTTAMSSPHWVQYTYTITIDESEKEIVTALTVDNTVEGLDISSAEIGVMERSKNTTLRMTAANGDFTKLFLGTVPEAQADGAETIALSDEKVFTVSPFTADKKITVSFYSKKGKTWHEATLKADTSAKTLTLTEGKKADYSKVEAAKKKVPSDLSIYKEARVKTLNEALDAVVEGLYASEQDRVDAFADAITKAVKALEKEKLTIKVKAVDQETGKKIKNAVITVKNEKGKKVKAEQDGVYSLEDGTYTIQASADGYEKAEQEFTPTVEETVTLKLKKKVVIPPGTTIFEENEKDPSKTNLFNTTGMFKVVSAKLVSKKNDVKLTVVLSGQGYHYLYKGTYEEALANGLNKKNWIKGSVNSDGKWEFVIPLEKSESFIPIVAISDTHLQKVEKGEEELGDAIFARQIVLDLKKKTLTAGDYDEVADITVISKTEKFKADSKGTMEIIGGPNSNNYACKPAVTMQDKLYTKAFIGTAEKAAAKGAKTIALQKNTFLFEFVNSFGGSGKIVTFEDKKPIAVAFYDSEEKAWTDYKLTIDKTARTVTIEALKEDETPPEEPENEDPEKPGYQDDSNEGTSAVDSATTLADGVYTPKSFTFSGGTGKVVILCDKLEVRGGQAYATIRFAKQNGGAASVDSLRANGQTYSGNNVFTIPVELNANNKIVGRTTAMSQPHWVEYSIFIALDEPGKESSGEDVSENTTEMDKEAPAILGLSASGETEIVYSDLIKIFNYEGGYYLIELDAVRDTARDTVEYRTQMEIAEREKNAQEENGGAAEETAAAENEELAEEEGSSQAAESISEKIAKLYENEIIKYLIIPEGKEVPAGLDKEVIIISQPADKAYVSSAEALDMIAKIGAGSNVTTVGVEEDKVSDPAIKEAMGRKAGEEGAIQNGGSYDDWDLRTMITAKTNLAVQSPEILPGDEKTLEEDMENLVRLGQRAAQMEMAMFIDRSEDEANALAKAEWYKVYGVIFGAPENAQQLYQEAVNAASDSDKAAAEAALKTRAEEKSKMKAEAKEAADKQTGEDK